MSLLRSPEGPSRKKSLLLSAKAIHIHPLMEKLGSQMDLPAWCEGVRTGIIKIRVQIDNDGGVKQRKIVGFQPTSLDTKNENYDSIF